MITNDILKAKYETQKRLDKDAEGSLEIYVKKSHQNIQKAIAKYGLKLKYGTPEEPQSAVEEAKMA